MKTYKEYNKKKTQINEGLIRRQAGMGMEAKIEEWIQDMEARNVLDLGGKYEINTDMTITCKHHIFLVDYGEE